MCFLSLWFLRILQTCLLSLIMLLLFFCFFFILVLTLVVFAILLSFANGAPQMRRHRRHWSMHDDPFQYPEKIPWKHSCGPNSKNDTMINFTNSHRNRTVSNLYILRMIIRRKNCVNILVRIKMWPYNFSITSALSLIQKHKKNPIESMKNSHDDLRFFFLSS